MGEVIEILNSKPKSTRPSQMCSLTLGTRLALGRGTYLELNKTKHIDTEETVYFFALHRKDTMAEARGIDAVITPTKESGLRVTPISIVLTGPNKGTVHLYIQLTKSLKDVLLPAS